jgi:hypothetical protein
VPYSSPSQLLERFSEFIREAVLEKKVHISLVVIMLTLISNSAIAEPPPAPIDINERLVIEACILTSEKPHISMHVPGTVNVKGRTICKGVSGERQIKVTVTLTRLDGGNTPPITKSKTGRSSLTVNVAMACIWSGNQSAIKYRVRTVHRMSNGKSGITENGATLKC